MTNYCPGCNHPVLLRAPDGTCGGVECKDFVAARNRGEPVTAPYIRDRIEYLSKLKRELNARTDIP